MRPLLLGCLLLLAAPFAAAQIALPVTFEDSGLDYELTDFGGAASTLVADPTGATNTVVRTIRPASAECFAGTTVAEFSGFTAAIPFAPGATTMSVRVWSPAAGIRVLFKVEQVGNPGLFVETLRLTTVAGAWETLVFDFGNPGPNTNPIQFGANYNKASIFFDFQCGLPGAPAAERTYYWDNVEFGGVAPPPPPPVLITLPVTFEQSINYELTDFGGTASALVADPTDAENTVVQTIRTAGAACFAGTTVAEVSGFSAAIPFAPGATTMSVRVWSPAAGIRVLFKVEQVGNPGLFVETLGMTTVAGAWETLVFDFGNPGPNPTPIQFGANYNKASIFFDFSCDLNPAPPAPPERTYYWDDVTFGIPPSYAVTAPAAGAVLTAGTKTVVRWTGPGVPDRDVSVDVFLRDGAGAETLLGSGPNNGRRKVTIPAGTLSGSDYTFVVRLQSDPASVYGLSDAVIVSNPAEQYTFSEPDAGESWARGFTRTVQWATPVAGPQGGTVTLTLQRDNGTVVFSAAGEPDDGAFDYAIPSNLATGTGLYFTIVNEADAAFLGRSAAFDIVRIEPTAPAEGSSWAVGSSQTVTWNTGAANNGGVVRLSLRGVSNGYSRALAVGVPYGDGTRTVTVPSSGSVPPAGEYFVQLLYTYTPPGGVETRYVSNSNRFTVTSAVAAPVVARHFAAPLAGEDTRATVLAVRGLSEGAEVGVFAPIGGGSEVLLAAGVVEGGEAVLAVPSVIAEGEDELAFGPETALVLRAFEAGTERTLEARSITTGEGVAAPAVRFAEGEIVTVDVSKGASSAGTDAFALAGVVPNPTSGSATVRFTVPSTQAVTVTVYDLLGRTVATLFEGTASAGVNAVSVPPSLTAGVYVVRVSTASTSATSRFTVVR